MRVERRELRDNQPLGLGRDVAEHVATLRALPRPVRRALLTHRVRISQLSTINTQLPPSSLSLHPRNIVRRWSKKRRGLARGDAGAQRKDRGNPLSRSNPGGCCSALQHWARQRPPPVATVVPHVPISIRDTSITREGRRDPLTPQIHPTHPQGLLNTRGSDGDPTEWLPRDVLRDVPISIS